MSLCQRLNVGKFGARRIADPEPYNRLKFRFTALQLTMHHIGRTTSISTSAAINKELNGLGFCQSGPVYVRLSAWLDYDVPFRSLAFTFCDDIRVVGQSHVNDTPFVRGHRVE